jgi:hypothetical protein
MRRLLILAAVALTGCAAPRWYHPTASAAQFNQDRYECTMQANALFPPAMTNTSTGVPPTTRTNCTAMGNQMSCTSRQNPTFPIQQFDQNAIPRNHSQRDCLYARGYVNR